MQFLESRWRNFCSYAEHRGVLDSNYKGVDETKSQFHTKKILVLGAGGLGCEILKDLALSGFTDIHVIDMDTIDISNLNRQFLFQVKDVGKNKCDVAAEFVNNRVKTAHVTPRFGNIMLQDDDYYLQFDIIISGLDAVVPRSWMNITVQRFAKELEKIIFFIDGGSDGMQGQVTLTTPGEGACYDCTSSVVDNSNPYTFPECTLAAKPRQPAHCVMYFVNQFEKQHGRKPDGDKKEEVDLIYQDAKKRAEEYKILGVDEKLTIGVMKNIIPAVASTNSIIAAATVNEAVKIVLSLPKLDTFYRYTGNNGINFGNTYIRRNPQCPTCGRMSVVYELDKNTTVAELIKKLKTDKHLKEAHPLKIFLENPFLRRTDDRTFYNPGLKATHQCLTHPISEYIEDGGGFITSDKGLPAPIDLTIKFAKKADTEKD